MVVCLLYFYCILSVSWPRMRTPLNEQFTNIPHHHNNHRSATYHDSLKVMVSESLLPCVINKLPSAGLIAKLV